MPTASLFDISRPINATTPVYPGDPPFSLRWTERVAEGGIANVTTLTLSAHLATHTDSPYHLFDSGERIAQVPLDRFVGPARVVTITHTGPIAPEELGDPTDASRVLIHTPASALPPNRWPEDIAYPSLALVERLVDEGIILFGTDAPSVDALDSDTLPIHRELLSRGIVILEGLWLRDVPDGDYELIALPLKLTEGEASPVRAILREVACL